MIRLLMLLLGLVLGAGIALLVIASQAPPPLPPPPAARPGDPDLSVTLERAFLVREVNRRAGDTLRRYDLRDPRWTLGEDESLTLDATGQLPLIGGDVAVRVVSQLRAREGALRAEVERVNYGGIQVAGGALEGLAEDLNRDLAELIDPKLFEVQAVDTAPDSVVLRLRVVGEL